MFNRDRVSFWEDEVLKVDGSDGCVTMWIMCLMPLRCTLKNGLNDTFYVCFTTNEENGKRELTGLS